MRVHASPKCTLNQLRRALIGSASAAALLIAGTAFAQAPPASLLTIGKTIAQAQANQTQTSQAQPPSPTGAAPEQKVATQVR